MKQPKKKYRNPLLVAAKVRNSSGPMRNKKDKRNSGRNKKEEYLNEEY